MYFTYCTMARYTVIIALFLCSKETNAQIKNFMNNANLRQDAVQDGSFGNLGVSSVPENINSNTNFLTNSFPQRISNFPSSPTNDHFFSNSPHHFSQQQSFNTAQSSSFPVTSSQKTYQPTNSVVSSPLFKSFNFQDTSNLQKIVNAQESKQSPNPQNTPLSFDILTPISTSDESLSFLPEQILQPDINANINPVVTVTQSMPSPVLLNIAESSPFSVPTVIQLGNLLPTHAQPIHVLTNLADPQNTIPNYIISSDLPVSTYFEKSKPSIWKELLPLIINMIKEERSRGCCGCKCCCKNKKNNKLDVGGGYSSQMTYSQSDEETNDVDDLSDDQCTQTSDEENQQQEELEELEDDSEET